MGYLWPEEPDVIQIRRTFEDPNKARDWEHTVLKRMKVVKDPKWINQTDNKCFNMNETTRKKISKAMKGVKKPPGFGKGRIHTQEHRNKLSISHSKPISCDGVIYQTLKEARDILNLKNISYRLNSPNFPNWFRLQME